MRNRITIVSLKCKSVRSALISVISAEKSAKPPVLHFSGRLPPFCCNDFATALEIKKTNHFHVIGFQVLPSQSKS